MAREHNPDVVLWVDLEMTGLNPEIHRVIELAAVLTNWKFQKIASYHAIVKQSPKVLDRIDKWCLKQHAASGLLTQVLEGKPPSRVEKELLTIIDSRSSNTLPIILAGSSIHFDRRFILREFPNLEARLHYRMLDVSAWKVVMRSSLGIKYQKLEAHRALQDIHGSIEELSYYLSFIEKK